MIQGVSQIYAGRASSSPMVDLFITLLSMGMNGYKQVLHNRLEILHKFPKMLSDVAQRHGERLLECPANTISFGITLDTLGQMLSDGEEGSPKEGDEGLRKQQQAVAKDITSFGAMLFSRCVSGTRVVPRHARKKMGQYEFQGFGSSTNDYPHAYMTAACAVGVDAGEINEFLKRLDKTLKDFKKKKNRKATKGT